MFNLKTICIALLMASSASAIEKEPVTLRVTLNQIIFSESDESWSSRDLHLFEKVMIALNKKNISSWTQGLNEDFLLSRLSYREATLFEVTPEKIKISEVERKKISGYTAKEIDDELKLLGAAFVFIDLKENQLKQKDRFEIWLSHLKRKYQVKMKSAEPAL